VSSFGFTFLSRKALGQAEQSMFGGAAGVRDDRFFPGTSVLHTRLRYALLIPWIYQSLRDKRPAPRDFARAYVEMEHDLTGRLKSDEHGGEPDGVIGGEVYPRSISQPPAYVYWTALTKWGLIGSRPDRRPWSRADMAKLLSASRSRSLHDDDGKPFDTIPWPIPELADYPQGWEGSGKLTLALSKPERRFLAAKLRAVRSPLDPNEASLLAKLVGKPLDDAEHCWDDSIMALAGKEAPVLRRAGQAAALSAIGRAIYAAQVETLKEVRDKRASTTMHREHLPAILATWGGPASMLDMSAFVQEVDRLPEPVETVLKETWDWVRKGGNNPMALLGPYLVAERSRKRERARLADTQFGVDRRLEWQAEQHGLAQPLHYRWRNVQRLLRDLTGVS
jgi:hypothetical protein